MKANTALTLLLLIAVTGLGYAVRQNYQQAQLLTAKIDALNKKADETSRSESLALQEKCASRADSNFQRLGYKADGGDLSTYTSHYNQRLNKCFMAIVTTTISRANLTTHKQLFDAFEMKIYGEVSNRNGKDVWCHVIVDGVQLACKPGEDWGDLIKIYMEK